MCFTALRLEICNLYVYLYIICLFGVLLYLSVCLSLFLVPWQSKHIYKAKQWRLIIITWGLALYLVAKHKILWYLALYFYIYNEIVYIYVCRLYKSTHMYVQMNINWNTPFSCKMLVNIFIPFLKYLKRNIPGYELFMCMNTICIYVKKRILCAAFFYF